MITTSSIRKTDPNRNAFWVGMIMGVAMLVSLIYSIVSGLDENNPIVWQIGISILMSLLIIFAGFYCAWLGLRGKGTLAGIIILLVINLAGLVLAALIGEAQLITGIRTFITSILIGILVLPQEWASRVTFSATISAVIYGLLQLFPLPYQIVISGTQVATTGWLMLIFSALPLLGMLIIQFPSLPLQSKFSISALISMLAAVGLITGFIQSTTQDNLERQIGLQLQSIATAQGYTIGDLLSKGVETLQTLALNDVIGEQILEINQAYAGKKEADVLRQLEDMDRQWIDAVAGGNTNSQSIQAVINNPATKELDEFIALAQENEELILTDQYGGLIASNIVSTDYYQGDETWWKSASVLLPTEAYISPPSVDENTGVTSIILAIPIYDEDQFVGVLRSTYNIAALTAVLDQTRIGETGEGDIYFSGEMPQHMHSGGIEETDSETWQRLLSVQGSYGISMYEGVESILASAPIRATVYNASIERTNWRIGAHQDVFEAFAPVRQQTQFIVFLSIVIGGVITGLSIGVAQILSAPISSLTQTASALAKGDFSVRSEVKTDDEIGRLASGFNEMAKSLQQSVWGLEQRIIERTTELTLAGELGRSLSRMRDMDELLNTAVDLIQARYNLYYVQLYLTDPEGKLLFLRSGTGLVGQELLRRNHRLPIGAGSLNGRAAAERRPIVVSDTRDNLSFRPNVLLPETRSEMAIPLLVGEEVVGVLDMQSKTPGDLNPDKLSAFESLAGQLAIAINNSRLYAEVEESKSELQEQTQKLSRQNWDQYFTDVEKQNAIGFHYKNGILEKALRKPHADKKGNIANVPISVSSHDLGVIQLARKENEQWSEDELEVIESIAQQVSVQLENFRLLNQAEQYRKNAEEATQRLTRQAWQTYLAGAAMTDIAYSYEDNQVIALEKDSIEKTTGYGAPLRIQNETVGEIMLEGAATETLDEEKTKLLLEVAGRLSSHLETLRLERQNQQSLARTESLYQISQTLLGTQILSDLVATALETLNLSVRSAKAIFIQFDLERQQIQLIYDTQHGALDPHNYAFEEIVQGEIKDVLDNHKTQTLPSYAPANNLNNLLTHIAGSTILAPIKTQEKELGVLIAIREPGVTDFKLEDVEMVDAVANQFAIAIINRDLLEQTFSLYSIIAELNSSRTYQEILETISCRSILGEAKQFSIIGLYNKAYSREKYPEWISIVAHSGKPGQMKKRYPLHSFEAEPGSLVQEAVYVVGTEASDTRLSYLNAKAFANHYDLANAIFIPLQIGDQTIGFILGGYEKQVIVSSDDVRRLSTIAGQAAISLQSLRLLEAAQDRARREQILREAVLEINTAIGVEDVLKKAAQQLGSALQRPSFAILKQPDSENHD